MVSRPETNPRVPLSGEGKKKTVSDNEIECSLSFDLRTSPRLEGKRNHFTKG